MKVTILLTLTVVITLSCNHSDREKIPGQNTENANKQDSASGYANVNGLKGFTFTGKGAQSDCGGNAGAWTHG
jgi:hypothetical protein